MTRKRQTRKKRKTASPSGKTPAVGIQILKVLLGTALLVILVVAAGILAGYYLAGPKDSVPPEPEFRLTPTAKTEPAEVKESVKYDIPKFEVFPRRKRFLRLNP